MEANHFVHDYNSIGTHSNIAKASICLIVVAKPYQSGFYVLVLTHMKLFDLYMSNVSNGTYSLKIR